MSVNKVLSHHLDFAELLFSFSYYSDLFYFSVFRDRKSKLSEENKYHLYLQFMNEYGIHRNITSEGKLKFFPKLLSLQKKPIQIDDFETVINELKNFYPQHKGNKKAGIPISLTSKLLMLIKPEIFIPYDRFNCHAIKYHGKSYTDFLSAVNLFKQTNIEALEKLMNRIEKTATQVENCFEPKNFSNIEMVRKNRVLDKLMLAVGQKGN